MNNTQDSEQSMRQQEKGENDPTLHGSTFARVEMCDDTTNHVPRSAPLSVSSLLCMEETSIDVMETPHREALHCTATVPTDGSNVETSCPILCSVPLLESTYSKSEKSKDERKLRNQDHHEATKSDLNTSKTRDAPSLLPATKLLQLNHSDAQVPLTLQLPVRALHTPLNFASNPGLPMHLPAIGAPGAIPPGSFYQMTAAIKASEVPPVFRDRPQRSGKWTREEEVYAELLIELFEKGHIDERNGCTLRSFLSRKLHCAPMRISKKYAGKGIGKMVFLSKSSFRGIADGIGSPSYHLNIQRLRQAEATFYRSCFPELNVQIMIPHTTTIPQPYGSLAPPVNLLHTGLPPIAPCPGIAPLFQQPGINLVPQSSKTALSPYGRTNSKPEVVTPTPGLQFLATMPSATGLQASYASATGHLSTQQSLQQAYFSMSTVTQNEVSPHGVVIINGAHTSSANNDFQHTTQRQNDSLLVIEPAHSPPTHVSNNHTTSQIERDHGYNLTPASAPRIVGNVNDLPNFLEGFDMIASRRDANTPGKQHPTPDLAHFSPTYTSRSFDDFHRLLGKNLSPDTRRQETRDVPAFDINELPFPAPHIQNDLPMEFGSEDPANVFTNDRATHLFSTLKPKITSRELPEHHRQKTCQTNGQTVSVGVTGTELGADSYSIFAQQSAFAASQHSAYSSTRGNGDDSSLALLGDDLEMMLGDNYTSGDAISTPYCVGTHISGTVYTSSSRGATLVSEPSDQGSDEIHGDSYGSGTDNLVDGSSCSNDSDGSYSESSRKRARLSHHVYDDINAAVHQPIRDY